MVAEAVPVGPATRARENAFSTNAGICARRGCHDRNDSTVVENPVDNIGRLPANALFRGSRQRRCLLYSAPLWTRSSTGCSPTSRRRRASHVAQAASRPCPSPTRPATTGARPARGAPARAGAGGPAPEAPPPGTRSAESPLGPRRPRIAIYDTLTSPPRVVSVEERDLPALIASLAEKTYHYCREQGGQVPYTVIQELIENLLHAYFRDVVITILDNGQIVRISDHGPGVDDKDRAFQPGFTTATADQRQIIRGVGSGLPIARESLQLPARRRHRRGQPRRRRRVHHQDAAAGAPSRPSRRPARRDAQAHHPPDEDPRAAHGARLGRPDGPRQGARSGPGDGVSGSSFTGEDGVDTLAAATASEPLREEGLRLLETHPLTSAALCSESSRPVQARSHVPGGSSRRGEATIDDQLTLIWDEARKHIRGRIERLHLPVLVRPHRAPSASKTAPSSSACPTTSPATGSRRVSARWCAEALERRPGDHVEVRVVVDDARRRRCRRGRRRSARRRPVRRRPRDAAQRRRQPAADGDSSRTPRPTGDLNPRYVFDRFVIGPHNEYATAVARSVAETPADAYNPVFIYADTGLGKTHLTQAIAHAGARPAPRPPGALRHLRAVHRRLHQRRHRQGPHRGLQADRTATTTS